MSHLRPFCNMSNESFEMKMHFIEIHNSYTHSHALEIEQLNINAARASTIHPETVAVRVRACHVQMVCFEIHWLVCRRFGHLNVIKTIECCVCKGNYTVHVTHLPFTILWAQLVELRTQMKCLCVFVCWSVWWRWWRCDEDDDMHTHLPFIGYMSTHCSHFVYLSH